MGKKVTALCVVLVLALVVWNLYKGATVQKIGIPGFYIDIGHPTPTPIATMGSLDQNFNIIGHDISNAEAPSPSACQNLCLTDDRCKAMTFVYHPDHKAGICWLKSSADDRQDRPGMVSSTKIYRSK